MHTFTASFCLGAVLALTAPSAAAAQVTPEEHAAHHPEEIVQNDNEGGMGGMMKGGMGEGMGDMMRAMGVPPPKELYPSLMALPDLPLEKRADVQQLAHTRMQQGTAGLSRGLERLSLAAPGDNFKEMQAAVEEMRQGLAHFESGLAAHRALAEGSAPRNIALQWFKREMSLVAPPGVPEPKGPFGLSWFHFFSMALLIGVAGVTVWLHFSKVRRTQELLATLAASSTPPPSGPAPAAPSARESSVAGTTALPRPLAPHPPAPSSPHTKWSGSLLVCRTFEEVQNVRTLRLVAVDGGPLPFAFLPGQFLTVAVESAGKRVKRSYTIASSPAVRDYAEITVKREEQGVVSRILHDNTPEGAPLEVTAPAGSFTFCGDEAESIVLIGGGVGITPLMSVIRYLTDRGWSKPIHLLYCCRTTKDFIFQEELEYLQRRNPNLSVVATMTRERGTVWMGPTGRLTPELISSSVPALEQQRFHVCGPGPMMEAVQEMLTQLGVAPSQVFTEAFGPAAKKVASPPARVASSEDHIAAVTFSSSTVTAPIGAAETVLDVADANGVDIDSSCRVGTCGACKVKLLQGQVTMEVEDALDAEEKDAGWVLACQAKATDDLVVDA